MRLVGHWQTSVTTDEGWDGQGESLIRLDPEASCALIESGSFTLVTDDGERVTSRSLTTYGYDSLSGAWKLMSVDSRGYTHIAQESEADETADETADKTADDDSLSFEVAVPGGPSTRRIEFRWPPANAGQKQSESFQWAWQGRESAEMPWQDRLVMQFERRR